MTKLIATSVVRGSQQGESHGGVYLIDFATEHVQQVIDWNTAAIDWQGRGWDRGLRGISFDGNRLFIAASDELFEYDSDFNLVNSYRNAYLKHCHEICVYRRRLYLTSTGYDAILGFDLDTNKFCFGLSIVDIGMDVQAAPFNPLSNAGPSPRNFLHLNNVFCNADGMYISGLKTAGVLRFLGNSIQRWVTLPLGIHNAQPYQQGVLFNDTAADLVRYVTESSQQAFRVPDIAPTQLDLADNRIARVGFGRGLCVVLDSLVAAGSSPSTIALHDLKKNKTLKTVTLSYDVRNAIHGLEVWPF